MNSQHRLGKIGVWALAFWLLLLIAGCSSVGGNRTLYGPQSANANPNTVPKTQPLNKYRNPYSYKVGGHRYYVMKSAQGYDQTGYASWYGTKFHGHHTSNHERYDMYSMTAASTTLPIPTYVRVTNLRNNRTVIVKVNDRGPFRSNRIIDLSYAAAVKLGYASSGTALVRVTAINPDQIGKMYAANDLPPPQHSFYVPPTQHRQRKSSHDVDHLSLATNDGSVKYRAGRKPLPMNGDG